MCNPGIFLKEQRRTTKIPSKDSRCTDRDSNRRLPRYKSRSLPLDQNTASQTRKTTQKYGVGWTSNGVTDIQNLL